MKILDVFFIIWYIVKRRVCLLRLVVRTSGFHPDNRGSIPLGDDKRADDIQPFFILNMPLYPYAKHRPGSAYE